MEKDFQVVDRFTPGMEADADDFGQISIDGSCLSNINNPLPESSRCFALENITREDVLDYGNECFLLKSVLTEDESKHFIHEGEKVGFEKIPNGRDSYRSSQR